MFERCPGPPESLSVPSGPSVLIWAWRVGPEGSSRQQKRASSSRHCCRGLQCADDCSRGNMALAAKLPAPEGGVRTPIMEPKVAQTLGLKKLDASRDECECLV